MNADKPNLIEHRPEQLPHAWSAVGRFLWQFNNMEIALDGLLFKLLGVDYIIGQIFALNIDFRRKISIVSCAIQYQGANLEASPKEVSSMFGRMHGIHDHRNMFAHNTYSFDGDKFQFFSNSAKKDLKLAFVDWDLKRVEDECKKMYDVQVSLTELTTRASKVTSLDDVLARMQMESDPGTEA